MGAWGYSVLENDSACDWVSTFVNNKVLNKLVNQKHKEQDPNDLRAAAAIVIQLHKIDTSHTWFDQATLDKLIESLEHVLYDGEWFDSWVDSRRAKGIKREIRKYIEQLQELEGYGA